jgi:hypothetical protein
MTIYSKNINKTQMKSNNSHNNTKSDQLTINHLTSIKSPYEDILRLNLIFFSSIGFNLIFILVVPFNLIH